MRFDPHEIGCSYYGCGKWRKLLAIDGETITYRYGNGRLHQCNVRTWKVFCRSVIKVKREPIAEVSKENG